MNLKEVIAVQIVNNQLVALKTETEAAISRDAFMLQMSLDNIQYFINIAGKRHLFQINDQGILQKPTVDELKKALQF